MRKRQARKIIKRASHDPRLWWSQQLDKAYRALRLQPECVPRSVVDQFQAEFQIRIDAAILRRIEAETGWAIQKCVILGPSTTCGMALEPNRRTSINAGMGYPIIPTMTTC
jgi:hypothetical protein